jgi:hexosaminidase
MHRFYKIFNPIFFVVAILFGSTYLHGAVVNQYTIIPYPQTLTPKSGHFFINPLTVIYSPHSNPELLKLAHEFKDQLARSSGMVLEIRPMERLDTTGIQNAVIIGFSNKLFQNDEAYELSVSKNQILITAQSPNGVFYGLQSLYQLMPVQFFSKKEIVLKKWSVPSVFISDYPRFSYRGLHLDVSRHLYPVQFIKKYIDAMAIHKYNVFHWHLTDDQGWRIEIKRYPRLTKIGAYRDQTLVGNYYERFPQLYDKKPYGGFYTQAEAREIVQYARSKYITVIPEIEMPGHAQAAIAAYPFLSCDQSSKMKVATRWGVFKDVFCTRDTVFHFIEGVLTEIMDVFPSKYIHIGGDECPKDRWRMCPDCQDRIANKKLKNEHELQSYFIHRIEAFLNSHGRQIIGWDEILDGGIAPNASVMAWRGSDHGIEAAKSKHQVIMTPLAYCYFDKYQADPTTQPSLQATAIGGFLPLDKVYNYEPVPSELSQDEAQYIIGAQANVWTEYMPASVNVENMVFPRASAMAEVLWTLPSRKSWDRFSTSMLTQFKRFEMMEIQPSKAFFNVNFSSNITSEKLFHVKLSSDHPDAQIRYNFTGKVPTLTDSIYKSPISLTDSTCVTAVAFVNSKVIGVPLSKTFLVNKLTGLNYTKTLKNQANDVANNNALTDGVRGTTKLASHWVGVSKGADGEVLIDLQKAQSIRKFSVGLLNAPSLCAIVSPRILLYGSLDGSKYWLLADKALANLNSPNWEIIRPQISFPVMTVRYLKLVLKSPYPCNTTKIEGNDGTPIIFMDEIVAW